MATTPFSISIQLPEPSTSTVISLSLTSMSAESYWCILSIQIRAPNLLVLHCLASDKHALSVYPGCFSNSFSSNSRRARQSAADPANPQITVSYMRLNFFALFLKTVCPRDICPSPIITTWLPFLTLRMVVPWYSGRVPKALVAVANEKSDLYCFIIIMYNISVHSLFI